MDIDELDELVDYEEDAMMTDAVGDAGEEVDMDPIEEENQNDDEEMAAEADNVPEGTTEPESVAMTPMPFNNTADEMLDEQPMDGPVVNPTSADWPPAPTSVPAVPSRLPEASLIPPGIQHEEGRLLLSEVNSIAAEPPASPTKTIASFALPGMSRPPSPPIADQGAAVAMLGDDIESDKPAIEGFPVAASTSDSGREKVDSDSAALAVEEAVPVVQSEKAPEISPNVADGNGSQPDAQVKPVDQVLNTANGAVESVVAPIGDHGDSIVDQAKEAAPVEGSGHEEAEHVDAQHDEHDELSHEEQDEETGEPKYAPIVIEIVTNALRPLFFPLSEDNAESTERMTRPDSKDWETEPYNPLLPGMAEELYKAPLRDVFVALRAVLGEDWDESRGTEMILHERSLGLKIGEDNKHTDTLSLHDLIDLYTRCNCPAPMILSIEYDSVRFIAKYNAIKTVLDSSAAPPDVDSSSDEEESGEEESGEEESGEEESGEGGISLSFGHESGRLVPKSNVFKSVRDVYPARSDVESSNDEEESGEEEGGQHGDFGDDDFDGHDGVIGAQENDPTDIEDAYDDADKHEDITEENDGNEEELHQEAATTQPANVVQGDSNLQTTNKEAAATPTKIDASVVEESGVREELTTVPLPTDNGDPTEATLADDTSELPVADLEEDELEDDDDQDVAFEGDEGDEFGIEAAARQTERDAELADAEEDTATKQPSKDIVDTGTANENGLKRALDDEEVSDNERSVKRKLSPELPAE